jgi:hypothetical protein
MMSTAVVGAGSMDSVLGFAFVDGGASRSRRSPRRGDQTPAISIERADSRMWCGFLRPWIRVLRENTRVRIHCAGSRLRRIHDA